MRVQHQKALSVDTSDRLIIVPTYILSNKVFSINFDTNSMSWCYATGNPNNEEPNIVLNNPMSTSRHFIIGGY